MIQCTHVYKRYKNGTNALYQLIKANLFMLLDQPALVNLR